MTPLQFKENIKERMRLLWINIKYSWTESLEMYGKNWTALASTLFYNITFILFIGVIYGKVKNIVGYSYDEMMLLILIGEINIIFTYLWIKSSTDELPDLILNGNLDLILNKPLPALWYLSLRRFNIFDFIRNGLLPVFMISLLIKWSNLNLTFIHIFVGILIFYLGQLILHNIYFVVAIISGFFDKKGATVLADQTIDDLGRRIPIEGHNPFLKSLFVTLLPIGIAMGVSTSVILGKFDASLGLILAIAAAIFSTWFKIWFWSFCLKRYTSASS